MLSSATDSTSKALAGKQAKETTSLEKLSQVEENEAGNERQVIDSLQDFEKEKLAMQISEAVQDHNEMSARKLGLDDKSRDNNNASYLSKTPDLPHSKDVDESERNTDDAGKKSLTNTDGAQALESRFGQNDGDDYTSET